MGASVDWSDVENVRGEWPCSGDVNGDLNTWREGLALYDAEDDYFSMMRAGELMCQALRHHLYGDGILAGGELPETVHRVLYAAVAPPPDGRTLSNQARRQLRLALTIAKKHGWQPAHLGGAGAGDPLFGDKGCYMLFSTAISPNPDAPWEGDLKTFFTASPFRFPSNAISTPIESTGAVSTTETEVDGALERIERTIAEADAGDPASQARVQAFAAQQRGDEREALRCYEEAARLGDVNAMFDAGCLANELGDRSTSTYWWEAAASAGSGAAAYNLAARAYGQGDVPAAAHWWEQATRNGDTGGFAALAQLAADIGDSDGEARWARLGADAGHPFCLVRHSQLLVEASPDDPSTVHQALALQTRAAEAGDPNGMFMVGLSYAKLRRMSEARQWLQRADRAGYPDARSVIERLGL